MNCVYIVVFLAACFFAKSEAADCVVHASGLTAQEKQMIVDRHNSYRKWVANGQVEGQPPASNMKRMEWDDKLALAAQNLANTCVFGHQNVTDSRFNSVGQSIFWSESSIIELSPFAARAITHWYNDKDLKSPAWYNHYTQIVWANTKYIGCGYINYYKQGYWNEQYYVCNYGPGGNIEGEEPYKIGDVGCKDLCP